MAVKRPHTGGEEHPVGSVRNCPGCEDWRDRPLAPPVLGELAFWLYLIAVPVAFMALLWD